MVDGLKTIGFLVCLRGLLVLLQLNLRSIKLIKTNPVRQIVIVNNIGIWD
ncbi:hypothetical protein GCM10022257_25200 [Hyunsoonleella aestuarii]|uniref:Uncharacterized protein n=1 Tax=Hyunsoonleella aestuarii TaxID=912802 RepID=A0ABP8EED7_9FLAO